MRNCLPMDWKMLKNETPSKLLSDRLNLRVLKEEDASVEKILATLSHVALFSYNQTSDSWVH